MLFPLVEEFNFLVDPVFYCLLCCPGVPCGSSFGMDTDVLGPQSLGSAYLVEPDNVGEIKKLYPYILYVQKLVFEEEEEERSTSLTRSTE